MRAAGAGKWRFFWGELPTGALEKQHNKYTILPGQTQLLPLEHFEGWVEGDPVQPHRNICDTCVLEFQFSVNCRNLHFQPCWHNFITLNHSSVLCSYCYTARFPSRAGHEVTEGLTLIKSKFRNTIISEGTWKAESKDAESSRPTCWCWEMSSSLLQAGISFHESAGEIPEAVGALVLGRSWSYSRKKSFWYGISNHTRLVPCYGFPNWVPNLPA